MGKYQETMRRDAAECGYWTIRQTSASSRKARYKWYQIAQCTYAECNAIQAICERYPPNTPLQAVKAGLVKGGIRALFDKLIEAGFATAGDVQRSRDVHKPL